MPRAKLADHRFGPIFPSATHLRSSDSAWLIAQLRASYVASGLAEVVKARIAKAGGLCASIVGIFGLNPASHPFRTMKTNAARSQCANSLLYTNRIDRGCQPLTRGVRACIPRAGPAVMTGLRCISLACAELASDGGKRMPPDSATASRSLRSIAVAFPFESAVAVRS
jgi:hypothetical protein